MPFLNVFLESLREKKKKKGFMLFLNALFLFSKS